MGYDITFHSISKKELNRYFFEVIDKPQLAEERAKEISYDYKLIYDDIMYIYSHFQKFKEDLIDGTSMFEKTFSYCAAAIAGFLHPYWYSRNSCLSHLLSKDIGKDIEVNFRSLVNLSQDNFHDLSIYDSAMIIENYSASGYIDSKDLPNLKASLEVHSNELKEQMTEGNFNALINALDYAIKYDLCFIEASDVFVPISNEYCTNYENLRSNYLNNMDFNCHPSESMNNWSNFSKAMYTILNMLRPDDAIGFSKDGKLILQFIYNRTYKDENYVSLEILVGETPSKEVMEIIKEYDMELFDKPLGIYAKPYDKNLDLMKICSNDMVTFLTRCFKLTNPKELTYYTINTNVNTPDPNYLNLSTLHKDIN